MRGFEGYESELFLKLGCAEPFQKRMVEAAVLGLESGGRRRWSDYKVVVYLRWLRCSMRFLMGSWGARRLCIVGGGCVGSWVDLTTASDSRRWLVCCEGVWW